MLAAALTGGVMLSRPGPALAAEASGVAALFRQAAFWQGRNRPDLAIAALRRVLAVDPENARAKAMIADLQRPKAPPPREPNPNAGSNKVQTQAEAEQGAQDAAGQRLGDRALAQRDPGALIEQAGTGRVASAAPAAVPARTGGQTGGQGAPRRPYVRSAADTAGVYRIQGYNALKKGRYAEAEQRFRQALAINDNDADAIGGIGIVRLRQNRRDEARELLARAKQLGGTGKWDSALRSTYDNGPRGSTGKAKPYVRTAADTAGVYRIEGFKAIEQGKFDVAENRFQAALKINGNDSDATGGLGIVRLRTGRFDEARTLLGRAVQTGGSAKWGTAYQSATFYGQFRVAQAARDGNRLAEAERSTKALTPADARQDALARSLLADIYARQGRYAEAMAMYRSIPGGGGAAGAQSVIDIQTRQTRLAAMQAVSRGDYAGAERVFQQAMLAGSMDPWLRYEYARLLVAEGRVAQADGVIGPLTQTRNPESLYAAALYSQQLGRFPQANALMGPIPAASRTPQMNAFLLELRANTAVAQARQLQAQGRNAEALALLRQLATTPLPIAAAGTVADALYNLGDQNTAVALAQSVASLPVTAEPDAYQGTVVVLAKSGYDAVAVPLVQRVGAQSGRNPYNNRAMGRLNALLASAQADRLRLQGQYAQAFDVLQAAYPAAPGDVDILASLGRLYQAGQMYGQAVQVYAMVRQQRPNDVGNLMGYIDSAIGAGQYDVAREGLDSAMRLAPGQPEVYLAAARLETARGREGQAVKYLQQARALRGQQAMMYGQTIQSTNPFARMAPPQQQQMMTPQMVNPFALGATAPRPAGPVQSQPAIGPLSATHPYPQALHPGAAPLTALEG